jgi:hypothetical protein
MPRSRRPTAYGPEYELMLLRATEQGEFQLTLPSPAHAKAFRMKVYSYFTALRRSALREDLIAKANAVSLSVDGCTFLISPAVDTWDALLIREGLGITREDLPPEVPTAQSLLRAKLREIRSRPKIQ